MTKLEHSKAVRDQLIMLFVVAFIASYGIIHTMDWWVVPYDYWAMWVSILTLLGSAVAFVALVIAQFEYLEYLQDEK